MALIYCEKWLIWAEKDFIKALSSDRRIRLKLNMDNKINVIQNIIIMKQWIDKIEKARTEIIKIKKSRIGQDK